MLKDNKTTKILFDLADKIKQPQFFAALVTFQLLGATVSGTTEFFMFRKYFLTGIPDITIQNIVTAIFVAVWEFGIFAVNAPIVAIIEKKLTSDALDKDFEIKQKIYLIALKVLGYFLCYIMVCFFVVFGSRIKSNGL
jgi:hypothetical protein